MNMVFHSSEGFFLGVSAYPLRDNFQLVGPGQFLSLHGPVSWFEGLRFDPLHLDTVPTETPAPAPAVDTEPESGTHDEIRERRMVAEAIAGAGLKGKSEEVPAVPITPEIPLQPQPTLAELSERACLRDYGFVPAGWVTTYCLASAVGGGLLMFILFRGFWLTEGLVEQRKQK
ncbi:hypothetical protein HDU93_001385 [Gonapodya sp. JEL0774]|nr:hypothetical protein HDU93_001385 [Gonapodya sp. JEL0774]